MADSEDDYLTPEAKARRKIDEQLNAAGWIVQGKDGIDVEAGPGVAVREFVLKEPHGRIASAQGSHENRRPSLKRTAAPADRAPARVQCGLTEQG